ncbi:hypothetical protein C8R47DRAFT_1080670 [Mycena vitilis]|nr:hypothetical protein C8R47DRAFT_1080670 [Mycena vitilis]
MAPISESVLIWGRLGAWRTLPHLQLRTEEIQLGPSQLGSVHEGALIIHASDESGPVIFLLLFFTAISSSSARSSTAPSDCRYYRDHRDRSRWEKEKFRRCGIGSAKPRGAAKPREDAVNRVTFLAEVLRVGKAGGDHHDVLSEAHQWLVQYAGAPCARYWHHEAYKISIAALLIFWPILAENIFEQSGKAKKNRETHGDPVPNSTCTTGSANTPPSPRRSMRADFAGSRGS